MSLLGLSFHDRFGARTDLFYFCRAAGIAIPLILIIMAVLIRP